MENLLKDTPKKYELTSETIDYNGRVLHRIKALFNFGFVKKDDIGGYVENESNLSHKGNCWIYDTAKVYNQAKVIEDAGLYNDLSIDDITLRGNVQIEDDFDLMLAKTKSN